MDRTTKTLGRIGALAVVVGVTVLMVLMGGGVAQAAGSVPSYMEGYPCPPGFTGTVCSPSGWAVLIQSGEVSLSQAAAAGGSVAADLAAVGLSGPAATGVAVGGLGSSPIAAAGVIAVGMGGLVATSLIVDKGTTNLVQTPGSRAGWSAPPVMGPLGWMSTTLDTTLLEVNGAAGGASFNVSGTAPYAWIANGAYVEGGKSMSMTAYCRVASSGEMVGAAAYTWDGSTAGSTWWSTGASAPDAINLNGTCYAGSGFDHVKITMRTWRVTAPASNVTAFLVYYPAGHVNWTPAQVSGLTGSLVTTAQCKGPSGSRVFTVTVAAAGAGGAVPIEIPQTECGVGEVLEHLLVEWVTSAGRQVLYDYAAPTWITDIPVEYPGCTGGGCVVELWKIVSGGPSLFCGVGAVGCPEWVTDAAKADHFECRYGGSPAPLGLCYGLFRNPGSVTPNTSLQVDPVTGVVTGTADPIISTDPIAFVNLPVVVPQPAPAPVPPVPGPVGTPDPLPSSDSTQCYPNGWGIFNPAEWVQRPIMCALAWAFIPREVVIQAELQMGSDALASNGLLAVIPAAASVPGAVMSGATGGCAGGIAVIGADTDFGPLEWTLPCSPAAANATIGSSYSRWYQFATVMILGSGAWACFVIVRAYLGGKSE